MLNNILNITDTESKIWTKCPDSDAQVHNAGNFCEILNLKKSRTCKKISCYMDLCIGVWTFSPNLGFSTFNIRFDQHIKEVILLENGGQRNSQEKIANKTKDLQKKNPARASESGLLNRIFDSVSVIWGLFNILKL
jgi:hypothetical protein